MPAAYSRLRASLSSPLLRRYLCARNDQKADAASCEVSDDFSKHYGRTVYVCQGPQVNDLHGDMCTSSMC